MGKGRGVLCPALPRPGECPPPSAPKPQVVAGQGGAGRGGAGRVALSLTALGLRAQGGGHYEHDALWEPDMPLLSAGEPRLVSNQPCILHH